MANQNTINGKWNEIKGEIRTFWGNLTDDELEKTKGNTTSILGLLEQKYGEKKEVLQEKLERIYAKFESNANDVGSKLTNATENMKNRLSEKPAHTNVSSSQENSDHTTRH